MTRTTTLIDFLRLNRRNALLGRRSALLASLCVMASLATPTQASAGELHNKRDMTVSARVALHQLPDSLPPLPYEFESLAEQPLQSIAEEASKQAQAKYLAKKLRKPAATVRQYVNLAWEEAQKRDGLAPELLIAIMHKESSLRPKVQSPYGAQGLMQVVRRWHRDKLHPSESLFDPQVNVRVGADVLEEYLELAGGNLSKALKKYSGNSPGYANKVIAESRKLAHVAELAASQADVAEADTGIKG